MQCLQVASNGEFAVRMIINAKTCFLFIDHYTVQLLIKALLSVTTREKKTKLLEESGDSLEL